MKTLGLEKLEELEVRIVKTNFSGCAGGPAGRF